MRLIKFNKKYQQELEINGWSTTTSKLWNVQYCLLQKKQKTVLHKESLSQKYYTFLNYENMCNKSYLFYIVSAPLIDF